MADLGHIDPARGDVRGDQDIELPLPEALHGLLARALAHVALESHGPVPHGIQVAREPASAVLRPQEHDRAHEVLLAEQVAQQGRLLALLHRVEGVVDGLGRRRVGQLDGVRLVEERVREAADLAGHRGREEQVLAAGGELGEDPLDVGQEPHVEHVVRLIEHEDLDAVELRVALAHQVEQAAGAGDDDLRTGAKALDLRVLVHPAEHRQGAHPGVLGEGLELLVDLDRELAGRREDERTRVLAAPLPEPVEDGQREGCGLAGARLGEAEDIPALDHLANGLGLDRPGLLVAGLLDGLEDVRVESEGGKAALRTLPGVRCSHVDDGVGVTAPPQGSGS